MVPSGWNWMIRFGTKKETLVDPSNRSWDLSVNRVAVGFNWMSEMNGKVIAIDWDERESDCKWLRWKGKWLHISKMKGKVITNEWEEWESDCTWVKLKGKWFNRRDERESDLTGGMKGKVIAIDWDEWESDCTWVRWKGKWLQQDVKPKKGASSSYQRKMRQAIEVQSVKSQGDGRWWSSQWMQKQMRRDGGASGLKESQKQRKLEIVGVEQYGRR